MTYSSVIASVGVALLAARELATISGPHKPKIGVFALWLAQVFSFVPLLSPNQVNHPAVPLVTTREPPSLVDTVSLIT